MTLGGGFPPNHHLEGYFCRFASDEFRDPNLSFFLVGG